MIADLGTTDHPDLGTPDLVIIGSGPAGMTLARELANSSLHICVLESGLLLPTPYGDALRRVDSAGIQIKAYSRERVLGGASTTWSGLSSPLDRIDLEPRPYLRQSGWPITLEELLPLYAEAADRYRFPHPRLYEPGGFDAQRSTGDLQPDWDEIDEKVFLSAADPQNFGAEWSGIFEADRASPDLWLDATVTGFLSADDRVTSARIKTSTGREFTLSARAFVLATGGIENARLLLASDLGNGHDQVGRHLMNHPKNYHGILHLSRPSSDAPYFFGCLVGGNAGYAGLRLPESTQREQELLNSYIRLEPLFPWSDNEGVESFVLLVKRSARLLTFWKKRQADKVISLRDYSETGDDSELSNQRRTTLGTFGLALTCLLHLPSITAYLWFRLTPAQPRIRRVRLRNFMEMEPHPENRVTLTDATDANGQPIAHVAHAPSERDRRSLIALHEALERELPRLGLGHLETSLAAADPWPIDQDASHHMGGTRMGTDPLTSVVDRDLRLHSHTNLYCAGSSVFPSSGCANPTFTITALSIRLARHLRAVLASEDA
jgi:choline dehydrogenase-like flavoprotein